MQSLLRAPAHSEILDIYRLNQQESMSFLNPQEHENLHFILHFFVPLCVGTLNSKDEWRNKKHLLNLLQKKAE